jgi:hypothetical protein
MDGPWLRRSTIMRDRKLRIFPIPKEYRDGDKIEPVGLLDGRMVRVELTEEMLLQLRDDIEYIKAMLDDEAGDTRR